MCLSKTNAAIEMSYSPFFHEILFILTNTVVVDINFKNLNFKDLTKFCLFDDVYARADNLAKLIGTRIILTSANWEHKVQ